MKLDVTSGNDVRKAAEIVTDRFGKIDVLISNAGVFDLYPVSEAGSEKLGKIFDVNVLGLANLTKYFLPLLVRAQGRLIAISSESYKVPSPFQPYSVSKQALEALYNAISIELSLKGIKCVLIRPGAINTKILKDTIKFDAGTDNSLFRDEFISFTKSIPRYIRKVAQPEDVAAIVLKAGITEHPQKIYSINHNTAVTILSGLPAHIRNFLVIKNLKK
jgi:3-oxoacyl-[acyl-carrier protein] reductase